MKSSRTVLRSVVLTATAALVLASCSAGANEAEPDDSTTSAGGASSTDDNDSGATASCPRPEELTTVVVGASQSLAAAPLIYTAAELGYFEDENIEVEFQTLNNPSDLLTMLNSGGIDAGFGGLSAGFFNGIERGLEIAAVASHSSYPEGQEKAAGIFVRADLIESGEVSEIADLEGLTFGLQGGTGDIGNAGGFYLAKVLGEADLTLNDIEIVNVSQADTDTAFSSGAIDAAFLGTPHSTRVEQNGSGIELDTGELLANKTQGGLIFGPNLNEENTETGIAFVRALMRVSQELLQPGYSENEDIREVLAGRDIPAEVVDNTPEYSFDDELAWNPQTLEDFQQVFLDHGDVLAYDELKPYTEVTNEELRQAAADSIATCEY